MSESEHSTDRNRLTGAPLRVVVAGGGGFIGRALSKRLAADGARVLVTSRRAEQGGPGGAGVAWPASGQTAVVGWDGRSADRLVEIIGGADAAVNLCGENIAEGRWTAVRKQSILESRISAARAFVQAIGALGREFVYAQASAVGFYGARDFSETLDESTASGRGFLAEVCRAWEGEAAGLSGLPGVRTVFLRTGVVLGLGGGALASMLPAFKGFMGGWPGDGRQGMSWIHLADEVGAIRHALTTPELAGPVNLTAPGPVDAREFCKTLGRTLGRPCWASIPAFVLRAALGEMADELLLSGQRAVPKKLLATGYAFAFPTLAAALSDLLGAGGGRTAA